MMMCIGGVSDFEAQMSASVEQYSKWRSAEDLERAERSDTWLRSRQYADLGWGLGLCLRRVEPPRPYSNGRRFIPAWLAADREFYMAAAISCDYHGSEARHRLYGLVRVDVDTTVMVRRK